MTAASRRRLVRVRNSLWLRIAGLGAIGAGVWIFLEALERFLRAAIA